MYTFLLRTYTCSDSALTLLLARAQQNGMKFLNAKVFIKKENIYAIYKKKILLVIHTENKPSADCAQRWGVKEEEEEEEEIYIYIYIYIYQNSINQYRYKANVLVGNIKVDLGNQWFRENTF